MAIKLPIPESIAPASKLPSMEVSDRPVVFGLIASAEHRRLLDFLDKHTLDAGKANKEGNNG